MSVSRSRINFAVTAAAGALVWLGISWASDRREPWDSDIFWSIGFPLMLLINCLSAFVDPHRLILRGLASVSLQPVVMMVMAGEVGSMFPLGLIVFGIFGILYSVGGAAGAFVKRRFFPQR